MIKRNKIFAITVFLLVAGFISAPLSAGSDEFYPARVKDISDRAYEKALIELLDNAQESIVISMYFMRPKESDLHPVNRLMKNLENALERGVAIKVFLNTKLDASHLIKDAGEGKAFDNLQNNGAEIYLVHSRYMLHDKLIVVDKRYVVIGSHNWTASALDYNRESSVLIDSPLLAKEKLERIKLIHLKGEDLRGPPQISLKTIYPLPEVIELPKALMDKKRFFPKMLSNSDNRAMNLYLLLLAESERRKSRELYVSLEKLALDLGMPGGWTATDLRRQVIKCFRKLKYRYRLIEVRFKHSRAARVKLVDISGETFILKSSFFEPSFLAEERQNKKFVMMIEGYLQAEGKNIGDFSNAELGRIFHITGWTVGEGRKKKSP